MIEKIKVREIVIKGSIIGVQKKKLRQATAKKRV